MSVKLFPRKSTRKCALQKAGLCVSEKLRIYPISMNMCQKTKKVKGLVNTYSPNKYFELSSKYIEPYLKYSIYLYIKY